ncbi:methylated-DNA--[protein]-cysteine S-methyltransferase [Alkaliphilus serpentinus]|uniref:Methylated-DNA--protein-cysteine methyltransferase n=2 Tax=Alkaliphilus serpentinus TaxID=1482731 RepID=A0A833HN29_9FIRM|nr:methylated-DNA--[protein]-cysteine S-methyltransferase [Alkaliphilus serpentinus]
MVINLASTTKGLAFIDFNKDTETFNDTLIKAFPNGIIQSDDTENQIYIKQLQEYFSGTRRSFNLPLDLRGTPFQIKVWKALMEIPFGETVSYKFIAERIENPKGTRAVGMANNKNKIPIIIPCHRVVGSDGRLVGYGGGMEIKRTLLGLEGIKISEVDDRVIV